MGTWHKGFDRGSVLVARSRKADRARLIAAVLVLWAWATLLMAILDRVARQ